MPEYGPFIEYCCELYIHHDVVNAIVGVAIVFLSVLLVIGTALLTHHLTKYRS